MPDQVKRTHITLRVGVEVEGDTEQPVRDILTYVNTLQGREGTTVKNFNIEVWPVESGAGFPGPSIGQNLRG